jgi:hypothetical protein
MISAHSLTVFAAAFVGMGFVCCERALSQEYGETVLKTEATVERTIPNSRPVFRPKRKVYSRRHSVKAAKPARRAPAVARRPAATPIPKPSPHANPVPDSPSTRVAVVHDEFIATPVTGEMLMPNAVKTFRLTNMEPTMPDVSPNVTERHTDGRADAYEIWTQSDGSKYAILAIILALACAFLLGTVIGMWNSARWVRTSAGEGRS